jgi:hypothetical protein|eukprot:m.221431 g.221431  ORF g.221431 m.221431 type:complete len:64 (+) comp25803_c0_seq2:6329-6520(+)
MAIASQPESVEREVSAANLEVRQVISSMWTEVQPCSFSELPASSRCIMNSGGQARTADGGSFG